MLTPPFCSSVYSFVGFVFFVSLAHTQWNGGLLFDFVFCAPILIVVSMGQVFCCFSQILFWKQSQVPGSSCCKSVFVFIASSHFPPCTNSFMFVGMFLSCSQVIIVWLSTAAAMLSNNTNSEFCLKVVNNMYILFLLYFVKRAAKKIRLFVCCLQRCLCGGEPNYGNVHAWRTETTSKESHPPMFHN